MANIQPETIQYKTSGICAQVIQIQISFCEVKPERGKSPDKP